MRTALVTGGAGFIGSHLSQKLAKSGYFVKILDNLSTGTTSNIAHLLPENRVVFIKGDCTSEDHVKRALKDVEAVFHFAADSEVRLELTNSRTGFKQNTYATHLLLKKIRNNPRIHTLVFASSSTVYGDAKQIPTPENYSPLEPISLYGAFKLASENLIIGYAHTYNMRAVILRLANIIGPKSQHGVIFDFIRKLQENPNELEILGDGTQTKSYLYIEDCVQAIQTALKTSRKEVEIYNVGSQDQITVREIAKIVLEEMKLKNVRFSCTGGVDGGRGWKGDVKNMLLDIAKLKQRGWQPRLNSSQAVRRTAKESMVYSINQKA